MTPGEAHDLLQRHVLWSDEPVEAVETTPADGIAVDTALRRFMVESQRDGWAIGAADDTADVVVATRYDLLIHGQPERFAILIGRDGSEVYLNDPDQLAALAPRLPDALDPAAFAEVLVQLHPYSSAERAVLVEADDLRVTFGRADLPAVEPLRLDGGTLRFASSIVYRTTLTGRLLDVAEWTVQIPAGAPATWASQLTHTRIPLDVPEAGVA